MERIELLGPEVAEAARRIGAQLSAAQPPQGAGDATVVPGEWAFNGAAPCWSAAADGLLWADTLAPAIHRANTAADSVIAQLEQPIQALLPHARGAGRARHRRLGTWSRPKAQLQALPGLPRRRVSAVCTGPGGTFWACIADGERWRVTEIADDGRALGGWRLSEPAAALAWDAAGQTLYLAAAGSGTLYSARAGSASVRRLATVPKGSGPPRRAGRRSAGGVWSALRDGWSVVRFEADGSLDRVVALPVPCPTDVGFGGDDGDTLFVTSARDAVTREALDAAPLSGRLFAVHDVPRGVLPVALGD